MTDLTQKTLYTLGNSIYLLTNAGSWGTAQAEARSYAGTAGNLVTINDRAEQIFLAGLFVGQTSWIGYNDSGVEGTFRWISGENSTYTHWSTSTGQPDNYANREDFAVLGSNGSWTDVPGYTSYRGIVEIKNPSTPIFIIEDLGIIEPAIRR